MLYNGQQIGSSNGWAESRLCSLDLEPDLDNANVGKYMLQCLKVKLPLSVLRELGAPLFTGAEQAPDDTD